MSYIIDPALPQWKGNLHCHTTESDGHLSPAEVVWRYRQAGYDFLAITDHRRITAPPEADSGLLMLSGIELDYRVMGRHMQAIHILGVGMGAELTEETDLLSAPQRGVDLIRAHGGLAIFAHPAWSLAETETIEALRGLSAAEIYNHVSDAPWNPRRGDSSLILDACFSDGFLLPAVAGDDAHHYTGDECHSAVIACAEACTREQILSALDKGSVYASQGPRILSLSLSDGEARVECTPCRRVFFTSNFSYAHGRMITGECVTEASYRVQSAETYIRVELEDEKGLRAWSSPIPLPR